MAPRVLCIGECMAELGSDGAGGYRLGFGGDTLNTALYMARLLGPGQVGYVTRLGDDPYSLRMRQAWEAEGIDCGLVETVVGATVGLYAIDTDAAGEHSFTYWRGEAPARELFTRGNWHVRAEAMGQAAQVYFSGISLAVMPPEGRDRLIAAAAAARAGGALVAVDPNHRPRLWSAAEAGAWIARAYGAASAALTSAEEEQTLFPDSGEDPPWPQTACAEVIAKTGAAGASVAAGGTVGHVPGVAAGKVVDTTGAGDAFNAAYLAARLCGAPPVEAARHGCALGARVVAHRGAIIPRAAMQDLIDGFPRG
ncbi:MAG TPA: sugar kinase [Thermohalobaculum sp.]|nr:sugar kinase [Thermohalobaculum sp.]